MNEQLAFIPKENRCALDADEQGISVKSPYNSQYLIDFKQAIPPSARVWNNVMKRWFIDAAYAPVVAQLIEQHYGEKLSIPKPSFHYVIPNPR